VVAFTVSSYHLTDITSAPRRLNTTSSFDFHKKWSAGMAKSSLPVTRRGVGKEVECTDRIVGWLDEMRINKPQRDAGENGEDAYGEKDTSNPITPPRRPATPVLHEEISPTDTSFSGYSIFDVPVRRKVHFGSPTPKSQIRDDWSDVTSVGDDAEWELPVKEKHLVEPPAAPNFALRASSPSVSVISYDPPSNVDGEEAKAITTATFEAGFPPHDPNVPRLVWITSCLQCTLANLPCSRIYPACSRCKRKGFGHDCLLYRRSFAMEALDHEKCKEPILLKARGEDEEAWRRKLQLAEELKEEWAIKQEAKNWVIPDISSPRATLEERVQVLQRRGIKKKGVPHPGEGMGRMTCKELVVDLDA
jgi:hypothetical protein